MARLEKSGSSIRLPSHFCGQCSRIRLTADADDSTCLFSNIEYNIKSLLRGGASDEGSRELICDAVARKEERHHINETEFVQPLRTMSCIGG